MLCHAISHAKLMRESTDRVHTALRSSDPDEQLIARRIFDNPSIWMQWEQEHSGLMRQLANCEVRPAQVAALKHATLRLLHGRALFQYLRSDRVRGTQRILVMAHFRPGRSYDNAVVSEHNVYLKKSCSYLCTQHLGAEVVQDPAFIDPIPQYEQLYADYFALYCSTIALPEGGDARQHALLPLLKQQLNEYRWAILDPRRAQPFLKREAQLRSPTGDTMRLPVLGARSATRG
jgi:hypothetical protein